MLDTASLFDSALKKKRIRLRIVAAKSVPKEVFADDNRLRQVVSNYLSNAIKFSPAGGEIVIRAVVVQRRPVMAVSHCDDALSSRPHALSSPVETGQGNPSSCSAAKKARVRQMSQSTDGGATCRTAGGNGDATSVFLDKRFASTQMTSRASTLPCEQDDAPCAAPAASADGTIAGVGGLQSFATTALPAPATSTPSSRLRAGTGPGNTVLPLSAAAGCRAAQSHRGVAAAVTAPATSGAVSTVSQPQTMLVVSPTVTEVEFHAVSEPGSPAITLAEASPLSTTASAPRSPSSPSAETATLADPRNSSSGAASSRLRWPIMSFASSLPSLRLSGLPTQALRSRSPSTGSASGSRSGAGTAAGTFSKLLPTRKAASGTLSRRSSRAAVIPECDSDSSIGQEGDGKIPFLRIAVEDQGEGLKADEIGKLFQAYSQIRAGANQGGGGTGLGLVNCKRIVELAAGTVGATSTPGVRTSFFMEIPLVLPLDNGPETAADSQDQAALQAFARRVAEAGGLFNAPAGTPSPAMASRISPVPASHAQPPSPALSPMVQPQVAAPSLLSSEAGPTCTSQSHSCPLPGAAVGTARSSGTGTSGGQTRFVAGNRETTFSACMPKPAPPALTLSGAEPLLSNGSYTGTTAAAAAAVVDANRTPTHMLLLDAHRNRRPSLTVVLPAIRRVSLPGEVPSGTTVSPASVESQPIVARSVALAYGAPLAPADGPDATLNARAGTSTDAVKAANEREGTSGSASSSPPMSGSNAAGLQPELPAARWASPSATTTAAVGAADCPDPSPSTAPVTAATTPETRSALACSRVSDGRTSLPRHRCDDSEDEDSEEIGVIGDLGDSDSELLATSDVASGCAGGFAAVTAMQTAAPVIIAGAGLAPTDADTGARRPDLTSMSQAGVLSGSGRRDTAQLAIKPACGAASAVVCTPLAQGFAESVTALAAAASSECDADGRVKLLRAVVVDDVSDIPTA